MIDPLLARWAVACAPRPQDDRARKFVRRLGRIALALTRALLATALMDRAASLAYTTLLSLVPLLAVSFSMLKAFGARDALAPLLRDALLPLGAQATEVGDRILEFVDNIRVGVLGSLGVALLLYTVVTLVHKVELALNAIWDVTEPRRPARRIADYLSMTLAGPVLGFSALGLSDTARAAFSTLAGGGYAPLADAGGLLLSLTPHLLGLTALALLYGLLPNTRVRASAAIAGGIFALVLWTVAGRLFASLLADSNNYSGVYSGFAGAVLFILWLNVGWLIVLLGATVAQAWQSPVAIEEGPGPDAHAEREVLALALMLEIGRAHYSGEPPLDTATLTRHVCAPERPVRELLTRLRAGRLVVATVGEQPGWVPGRDLAHLPVRDIFACVRGKVPEHSPGTHAASSELVHEMEAAITTTLGDRTLAQVLEADAEAETAAPTVGEGPPPALGTEAGAAPTALPQEPRSSALLPAE